MGRCASRLADRLGAYDRSLLSYVWIHHFPMYQWDEHFRRWDATHNPFSGVHPEDQALLVTDSGDPLLASPGDPAGRARALQYDIALNGWELGGGSVRFHTRELLSRSFSLQGHSAGGAGGQVRRHPGGLRVRCAAARRHRPGRRSLDRTAHRPDATSARSWPSPRPHRART